MPRQSDLRFTFSVAASQGERPISLDVIEFKLIESLSAPYLLTLELSSPKADIDFARIRRCPAYPTQAS